MLRKRSQNPDAAFLNSSGKRENSGKVMSGNHRGQKTATTVNLPFSVVYAHFTVNTFTFKNVSLCHITSHESPIEVVFSAHLFVFIALVREFSVISSSETNS